MVHKLFTKHHKAICFTQFYHCWLWPLMHLPHIRTISLLPMPQLLVTVGWFWPLFVDVDGWSTHSVSTSASINGSRPLRTWGPWWPCDAMRPGCRKIVATRPMTQEPIASNQKDQAEKPMVSRYTTHHYPLFQEPAICLRHLATFGNRQMPRPAPANNAPLAARRTSVANPTRDRVGTGHSIQHHIS